MWIIKTEEGWYVTRVMPLTVGPSQQNAVQFDTVLQAVGVGEKTGLVFTVVPVADND